MKTSVSRQPLPSLLIAVLGFALVTGISAAQPPTRPAPARPKMPVAVAAPDFNREVRPILANHCLKCHGPDEKNRMGGLRLDISAGAIQRLASGNRAVVPGNAAGSALLKRIVATDQSLMPPAHTNKPLSPVQKDILRRWVLTGAKYEQHWAFVAPKQAPLPVVRMKTWPRNPVDFFTLAGMEKAGLTPAPEADRYTLARRAALDLIGLPPTPEEADAFVNDKAPGAYERYVDRLLASPRYGERWARRWLDLARYADTNGYEKDRPRSIYLYRDWVIKALNADMPFDSFTVRQIAGDMLPNPTSDDIVATGFHRNTMRNEEGGNDPLEYRFHAMTDRVLTTGTTWLGLTVGCAQCHTHKYDPITHVDYYRLMAFLDNSDEVDYEVPDPDTKKKRADAEAEIARREAALPDAFPVDSPLAWADPTATVRAASGATVTPQSDGSVLLGGENPDKDTYTVTLTSGAGPVGAVQIEALPDPSLGGRGPGRTGHGNFVLTEVTAIVTPPGGTPQAVKFDRAESDIAQEGFPARDVVDGRPATGWAVSVPGRLNERHQITLYPKQPVNAPAGSVWTLTLAQNYGSGHNIGRFRVRLGAEKSDVPGTPSREERRRAAFEAGFSGWRKSLEGQAVAWTVLRPTQAKANVPVLRILLDDSVLSTSDITKRDVYDVDFKGMPASVTALRIEVLPHPSLPAGGPGRVYYEGGKGDFWCNELTVQADGKPVKLAKGIASFGNGAALTDGMPDSGWSTNGAQGKANVAIIPLAAPLTADKLSLSLLFERYYASSLGRFRVSVTTDPKAGKAALLPDVEDALRTPDASRTPAQQQVLVRAYCQTAPELAGARAELDAQRRGLPGYATTLVFQERPSDNPRATHRHNRGEFTQPQEKVKPGVPGFLNPLPPGAPGNRLTFARWLVTPQNPLTARVTVNRQWAALFGRGIVSTTEDFGYQGAVPTHPELLDWLAVEFVKQDWSVKKLHRLIVTSATYRQAGTATDMKRAKDPENRLLSYFPPVRLEAEQVRDTALTASGLLSPKMYGPSVFPPQVPGVTTEGAYGPLTWTVSSGEDRYRRGLYTFAKRTAPYAMFTTFDAPSGEATCPRRDVSNTPLQALTLLNSEVVVEGAQALGRLIAARPGSADARATYLFRRCVTRPPTADELRLVTSYYAAQKARLTSGELDAKRIAGPGPGDPIECAAWAATARALLNLDEAIVKR